MGVMGVCCVGMVENESVSDTDSTMGVFPELVAMLVEGDAADSRKGGRINRSRRAGSRESTQSRKDVALVIIKSTRWKTEHRS